MEDRKCVHPTWRRGDVDDPSAKVAPTRVGLLQENHRLGGISDVTQLYIIWLGSSGRGRSLPTRVRGGSSAIHAVGLGITVPGPPFPRSQCFGSQVART